MITGLGLLLIMSGAFLLGHYTGFHYGKRAGIRTAYRMFSEVLNSVARGEGNIRNAIVKGVRDVRPS